MSPKATAKNWLEIERIVEAFELARREGAISIEQFCPGPNDPNYLEILQELIRVDLELSWSESNHRNLDDYRREFPILDLHRDAIKLIAFEEYRLRRQANEDVKPSYYGAKYQIDVTDWLDDQQQESNLRTNVLGDLSQEAKHHLESQQATRFPEPGELYQGFSIRRELGRGAIARVYLAEQNDLACRLVALKISKQLLDESQTLARLQHQNIVPVYSSHRVGAYQIICMPYLGATTLADVIKHYREVEQQQRNGAIYISTINQRKAASTLGDTGILPGASQAAPRPVENIEASLTRFASLSLIESACRVVLEVANGLAHAHARGIYHCDIKPANILVSDDGHPMLLDFNMATVTDSNNNVVGGTPYYMSPEQLQGMNGSPTTIDGRSDLYSLGLIFFELITGYLPGNPVDYAKHERIDRLQQLRQQPARVEMIPSVAVGAIIAKLLSPKLEQRYQSANEVIDDLQRHINHQPLKYAQAPLGVERITKWAKRNRWLRSTTTWITITSLFLILSGLGFYSAREQRLRNDAAQAYRESITDFSTVRLRLTAPNPDLELLRNDINAAEVALGRLQLDRHATYFDERIRSYLPEADAELLRSDALQAMMMVARAHDTLDANERAINWNRRAWEMAKTDEERWPIQFQYYGLLSQAGRNAEADAERRALGEPKGSTAQTMFLASEAFTKREFRECLTILAKANDATKRRADYWHTKGKAHAQLTQWDEAIAAFTTALTHLPSENDELYLARGQANFEAKKYLEAKLDFDRLIEQKSKEARYYIDRALVQHALGQSAAAFADLDTAEQLWPTYTRLHFIRVEFYRDLGDAKQAKQHLELGLKATPQDETSWICRGIAQIEIDPKKAIADFDQALKLNPKSRAALQNKASVLSESLNQPEAAIVILDRLIELYPNYTLALAGRGVLLGRSKKYVAARADAKAALARDQSPMTLYQVAGIYALTAQENPQDLDEVLRLLAVSMSQGVPVGITKDDREIDPVRGNEKFKQLLQALQLVQSFSQQQNKK